MTASDTADGRRPIRRALISVYDKSGLDELIRGLAGHGVELVSTGKTAVFVESLGVPVVRIEELTGFPETLDGRVKTLHPKVHAGLLADLRLDRHVEQLAQLGIEPFDLLVSNLYPFSATVASGADRDECVEQIDIGGPAMVRAAAKNHASVAVVTAPAAYPMVLAALADGGLTLAQRQRLAAQAFADIAEYDLAVAQWCATELGADDGTGMSADSAGRSTSSGMSADSAGRSTSSGGWPAFAGATLHRSAVLRYGENPHQRAALFTDPRVAPGLAQAVQLGGKDMSYNNYVDADAAWRSCHDFDAPAVAIIKHANPCGIAIGADVAQAHRRAHACDPISAYGGVIAANVEVTAEMAEQVAPVFTEVIVAPSYSDTAVKILTAKKNLRVLVAPAWHPSTVEFRQVSGGLLVQTPDRIDAKGDDPDQWTLATGDPASEEMLADLVFAWRAIRSVKSNAILLARDGAAVGVGMGQVNRVDSARLAVARAGDRVVGSVGASDAYFPFADGFEVLAEAGVAAVVEPGGSIRDDEVIAAAAAAGVTLYLTGTRHFFH